MRELYHGEFLSQREISNRLDCGRKTVHRWLKKHNIETRSGGYNKRESRRLRDAEYLRREYHTKDKTLEQIADDNDCDKENVAYWMRKHGIPTDDKSTAFADGDIRKLKDKQWLKQMYWGKDLSSLQIADQLDLSDDAVRQWMDRHSIEKRTRREASTDGDLDKLDDVDWMCDQYTEERRSTHAIAEDIGVAQQTVSAKLREYGVEMRIGGPKGPNHPHWKDTDMHPQYFGPNWDEQARAARMRDQARCRMCGVTEKEHKAQRGEKLHVHHKTPRSEFFTSEDGLDWKEANKVSNLVTLCRPCHMTVERRPFRIDWR